MHADFQALLALRDGEPVDATLRQHVEQCTECTRALAQLAAVKHNLRQLPFFEPPARRPAQRLAAQRRPSRAPMAALAASVAIAVLVLPLIHQAPRVARTAQRAPTREDPLNVLVDRSQRLDAVLQVLPPRPQVERAGTSATIDDLQNRIQLLDLQLSAASKGDLPSRDAQRLWSARVELMNSLVHIRYAEAAGSADLYEPSNTLGAI
jgi:hypothetical protein